MTPVRIGINGFGRIGRKIFRLAAEKPHLFQILGINDLSTPEQILHLLKYDSAHGPFQHEVQLDNHNKQLILKSAASSSHPTPIQIQLFAEKDPSTLPWSQIGVQIVHECTGIFTTREKAALHFKGGAQKVILSAPSKDADITLCLGVNANAYEPSQHHVISNASCTTNCLAPVVKVLDDRFGVIRGTMLTIHSYTHDQQLLDLSHSDLRRARAAALSQIPTTTGAAQAVGLVIPHLKGKLNGLAVRVPTPNVSLVDFTGELKSKTTIT